MLAAYKNQVEIVKLLLDKEAKIDSIENNGNTALMLAAQQGSRRCVTELLRRGADKTIKNSQGFDALMRAEINNNLETARELKKTSYGHEMIYFPITQFQLYDSIPNIEKLVEKIENSNKKLKPEAGLTPQNIIRIKALLANKGNLCCHN